MNRKLPNGPTGRACLARLLRCYKDFRHFLGNLKKTPLLFGLFCVYKYRSRDYVLFPREPSKFYVITLLRKADTTGSAFFIDPVRDLPLETSSRWGYTLLTGTQRKKSLTALTVRRKSVKLLNWVPRAYALALRFQFRSF